MEAFLSSSPLPNILRVETGEKLFSGTWRALTICRKSWIGNNFGAVCNGLFSDTFPGTLYTRAHWAFPPISPSVGRDKHGSGARDSFVGLMAFSSPLSLSFCRSLEMALHRIRIAHVTETFTAAVQAQAPAGAEKRAVASTPLLLQLGVLLWWRCVCRITSPSPSSFNPNPSSNN